MFYDDVHGDICTYSLAARWVGHLWCERDDRNRLRPLDSWDLFGAQSLLEKAAKTKLPIPWHCQLSSHKYITLWLPKLSKFLQSHGIPSNFTCNLIQSHTICNGIYSVWYNITLYLKVIIFEQLMLITLQDYSTLMSVEDIHVS